MIALIEQACGRPAERCLLPMQPGDVRDTFAEISAIQRDLGLNPAQRSPKACRVSYNGTAIIMGWSSKRSIGIEINQT
jgi:hypothetical protein